MAQLAEEQSLYDPAELARRSSDAAFAIDGGLRVLAWNAKLESLLGIPSQEMARQTCYGILRGRTEDGLPVCGPSCVAIECFLRDIPFDHRQLVIQSPQGEDRRVQVSTIVLPGPTQAGAAKAIVFLRLVPEEALDPTGGHLLSIHALGRFRVCVDNHEINWQAWPRKQAVTLLKLLVSRRGHTIHRETLTDALWPNAPSEEGWKRLKVVVHALRRGLAAGEETVNSRYILTENDGYRLATGASLWVDVDRFQDLARQVEATTSSPSGYAIASFEEASALYEGDYLEGDLYSDWVAAERERLQEMYLTLLFRGASLYARAGVMDRAVETCQKAIALDPCRESVHRLLMECLWKAGRRAEALRQFNACRQALWRELDVNPMPETLALHQRILKGDFAKP